MLSKVILILYCVFFGIFQTNPLLPYQWKNRLVLVFGSEQMSKMYKEQIRSLGSKHSELEDRDLVIFEVFEGVAKVDSLVLKRGPTDFLIDRYNKAGDGFRILLIGKDGTVKLDKTSRTDAEELFDLIDRMPMRRAEIKKGDQ